MEHLNMLDADFYFRLTDLLLSQDISSTLLLLDEVLEKGFEGNVIIEGLSEHMRNLLLCKDQRMARLLDVPNDHKPVYFEKANQAPPSFILSALNILSESELSFRNATNKRLHIEMCLIRLCYLQQVISATDVKKKLNSLDGPGAATAASVTLVAAPQLVTSPAAELPKTYPSPPAQPAAVKEETPIAGASIPVPPAPAEKPVAPAQPVSPPSANPSRRISKNLLGDLDAAVNNAAAGVAEKKELTNERVQELYDAYRQQLKAENKGFLSAQFGAMTAEVHDDEIRIVAPTDLMEEYAKERRNELLEHFRKHTGIMVRVVTEVRKDKEVEAVEQAPILSKTEVFESMARKNPQLQKLKEALNLQLDY
jgi:DNA polymerase-3 subunit gamma/tau